MLKDVYIFTNGMIASFDEVGQQRPELQGVFSDELRLRILRECTTETRITLARWRKGFFELTRDEFEKVDVQRGVLGVYFETKNGVSSDKTDSPC
jgi:hypothetical protein